MHTDIKLGCGALFKASLYDTVTGKERDITDWIPNLVTDWGLNNMKNTNISTITTEFIFDKMAVSTSNAAPAESDTSRSNIIAVSNTMLAMASSVGVNLFDGAGQEHYWWQRDTYVFPSNSGITSQNLASFSLGFGTAGSWQAVSVALIKDGSGNPTTISPLPNEELRIQREWRWYAATTYSANAFSFSVLDGANGNAVLTNHTGKLAAATSSINMSPSIPNSAVAKPFSPSLRRIGFTTQPAFAVNNYNSIANSSFVDTTTSSSWYLLNSNMVVDTTEAAARTSTVTAQIQSTDSGGNFSTSGSIKGCYVYGTVGAWYMEFSPTIARSNSNLLFSFSVVIDRKSGF